MCQEGRLLLEREETCLRHLPPQALCPPSGTGGLQGEKRKDGVGTGLHLACCPCSSEHGPNQLQQKESNM